MQTLEDIRPSRKGLVFDLAEAAGLDTADWIASSNDARGYKANPKYSFEWAYEEPGKFILLNLWHAEMRTEGDRIVNSGNFRLVAETLRLARREPKRAQRAARFDSYLQIALRDNLPIRVIVLEGHRRKADDYGGDPSSVKYRLLDPELWTITSYNWANGDYELARGIFDSDYVDQFDLDQAEKSGPSRKDRTGSDYVRDPDVRRKVRRRARGHCELCGKLGFRTASGAIYLETHHVVWLSDGGLDRVENVVALCADDHRRAHFAEERTTIQHQLQELARRLCSSGKKPRT